MYEMSGLKSRDTLERFSQNHNGRLPTAPISAESKSVKSQHIDLAYELTEDEIGAELQTATCQEDARDVLYQSLDRVIKQYKLIITPDDVMPFFWKIYGLKETV